MPVSAPPRLDQLAKVLVALGHDRAAAIMQTFPEEMLPDIAEAMVRVPELGDEDVIELLRDVLEDLHAPTTPTGDLQYAVGVIERAFGAEKATEVKAAIDPARKPFGFLTVAEPSLAARAISREPIGVLALALGSLDPSAAAKILKYFDEDAQAELHMRIATLAPVNEELFDAVERDMRDRITPRVRPEGLEEIPGFDVVVGILGQVSKKVEKRVLEQIAERDEELATRIKESLFTFEDITMLDNRAIQEVLKIVDTTDLSLALYPADESIRERFMSNLSTRARENLAEEIEFLRNPSGGDMKAAQRRIVGSVQTLEESGAISIDRGGDDDDDDE